MRTQKEFDYIKNSYSFFIPSTPKSALRAMEQGVLPSEAFVYKAASVKPVYEEPFDTREIERILAREDIDLQTLILIIQILQRLIHDPDSERALFAAESLNEIETRFTNQINALKEKLEKKESTDLLRRIGSRYYELALVSIGRKAIKNFYLKESFGYFSKVILSPGARKADFIHTIRILLQLELYSQAEQVLEKAVLTCGIDSELTLLRAENEFYRKNFVGVVRSCRQCDVHTLPKDSAELVRFWRGR